MFFSSSSFCYSILPSLIPALITLSCLEIGNGCFPRGGGNYGRDNGVQKQPKEGADPFLFEGWKAYVAATTDAGNTAADAATATGPYAVRLLLMLLP